MAQEPVLLIEGEHQGLIFLPQPVELQRVLEGFRDLVDVPRFADVAVHRSAVDGLDDHVDIRISGHQDPDGVRMLPGHLLQKLNAVDVRHTLVCQEDVDGVLGKDLQGLPPRFYGEDPVLVLEGGVEQPQVLGVVIHVEDAVLFLLFHGSLSGIKKPRSCRPEKHPLEPRSCSSGFPHRRIMFPGSNR